MEYMLKNIKDFKKEDIISFYSMISRIKKDKINKYTNKQKKLQAIWGEILLSELLKKHNIDYKNISYNFNEYGKPYIKNYPLFFNISHSNDYVITALADKEIGIDIEKIRPTSLKTIKHFATAKEKAYILAKDENIEDRLFKIYTLKEAYFKMLGTNLEQVLDVEFTIEKDKIYCSDKNIKAGFISDLDGYVIAYVIKL